MDFKNVNLNLKNINLDFEIQFFLLCDSGKTDTYINNMLSYCEYKMRKN